MFLPSWNGTPAALDFAIPSPHRVDAPPEALTTPGATATAYETYKRSFKNTAADCEAQGMAFIPMVGEPTGGWGPSAACTFKAFAKAQAAGSDAPASTILAHEFQHLCTAIRRVNARAVLCRCTGLSDGGTPALTEAAAVLAAHADGVASTAA